MELHKQRNSFVPVNRLPAELLIDIWKPILTPGIRYYKQLRRLRLVSTHWRNVIDQAACFWRVVSCCDTPKELEMAVSKSRGLSMDVYFGCRKAVGAGHDTHDHTEFSKVIQVARSPLIPRRSMTIKPFEKDWPSLETVLEAPAPHMEVLEVVADRSYRVGVDLFAGVAPRLEHVRLVGCSVPWTPGALSQLRSLRLSQIYDDPPSVQQLLDILSVSPEMELVSVEGAFSHDVPEAPMPSRSILPSLHFLKLHKCDSETLQHLLGHIVAPHLESLSVEVPMVYMEDSPSLISTLGPWLHDHAQRHPSPSLSLSLTSFTMSFQYGAEYPVSITFDGNLHATQCAQIAALLLNAMPPIAVSSISSLTLEVYHMPPITIVHPLLNSMTHLTLRNGDLTPEYSDYPVHRIVSRLSSRFSRDQGGSTAPPVWLFPRMNELTVKLGESTPDSDVLALIENRAGFPGHEEEAEPEYPARLEKLVLESGKITEETRRRILELGVDIKMSAAVTIIPVSRASLFMTCPSKSCSHLHIPGFAGKHRG